MDLEFMINEGKSLLDFGINEDSIKHINSSIKIFNKIIEIDYKNLEIYSLRAKANSNIGNYYSAINDYKKIISLGIDSNPAIIYNALANLELFVGEYKNALKNINKSINLDKKDYLSYFTRGRIKEEIKNPLDAINDYKKSIELNSFDFGIIETSNHFISTCKEKINGIIIDMDSILGSNGESYNWYNFN